MISNKFHTLYQINKGGIKTACVEFVEFEGSDNIKVSTYKLRGVDAKINSNDYTNVRPFNFNERNRFENFGVWDVLGIASIRYRLMGSKLRLSPTPTTDATIQVWYIPLAQELVSDTDTLDDFNRFREYIIVDTAIKMLTKEESDTTELENRKIAMKRRIEEVANNRDAGHPESVSDIYAEFNVRDFGIRD